jgi:hypothetical protein
MGFLGHRVHPLGHRYDNCGVMSLFEPAVGRLLDEADYPSGGGVLFVWFSFRACDLSGVAALDVRIDTGRATATCLPRLVIAVHPIARSRALAPVNHGEVFRPLVSKLTSSRSGAWLPGERNHSIISKAGSTCRIFLRTPSRSTPGCNFSVPHAGSQSLYEASFQSLGLFETAALQHSALHENITAQFYTPRSALK